VTNNEAFDETSASTDATEVEAPAFTETEATFTAPKVGDLYRYLNWINKVQTAYSISMDGFSTARREGVAVLVDHGLVSERRYVGGEQDGRHTFRVTPAGKIVLEIAWAAANEVVVAKSSVPRAPARVERSWLGLLLCLLACASLIS
jgi:hypothetical protein